MKPVACRRCGLRPRAHANTRFCYDCQPTGPQIPPPCKRCGSTGSYWSAGLCILCHRDAPQPPDSCRDCLAWGVTRHYQWLCRPCVAYRNNRPIGTCIVCGNTRPVDRQLVCRLCYCQLRALRIEHGNHNVTLDMARAGQQLMFANMHKLRTLPAQPPAPVPRAIVRWPDRPVQHEQLVLVDIIPDLRGRGVVQAPRDPLLAGALDAHVTDTAAQQRWAPFYTDTVRAGVRILLGLQHTPGAVITASEIDVLRQLRLPMRTIRELLTEVGMFHDDHIPAIDRWFEQAISALPDQIRAELHVWFDVMINGSRAAPRRRPRSSNTLRLYTRWALPALTAWANTGRHSLREISRDDLVGILPPAGVPRAQAARALRSIFEILKARRLVFVNPTARLHTWAPATQPPRPADLDQIAAGLDSTDPARAALTALVAFHALTAAQIRTLQLTDIRDRRLHLRGRTIPLAEPVQQRLDIYLAYRFDRWPDSANQHLFIHFRTARRTDPVGYRWLKCHIGYPGGVHRLRQDRILHEAIATGGDTRRLCDLFGLSISAASRYTNAIHHPTG